MEFLGLSFNQLSYQINKFHIFKSKQPLNVLLLFFLFVNLIIISGCNPVKFFKIESENGVSEPIGEPVGLVESPTPTPTPTVPPAEAGCKIQPQPQNSDFDYWLSSDEEIDSFGIGYLQYPAGDSSCEKLRGKIKCKNGELSGDTTKLWPKCIEECENKVNLHDKISQNYSPFADGKLIQFDGKEVTWYYEGYLFRDNDPNKSAYDYPPYGPSGSYRRSYGFDRQGTLSPKQLVPAEDQGKWLSTDVKAGEVMGFPYEETQVPRQMTFNRSLPKQGCPAEVPFVLIGWDSLPAYTVPAIGVGDVPLGAPVIGRASPGANKGEVSVIFAEIPNAPGSYSYVVISEPERVASSGKSSPIVVKALSPVINYKFRVRAYNTPSSSDSSRVFPGPLSDYSNSTQPRQ